MCISLFGRHLVNVDNAERSDFGSRTVIIVQGEKAMLRQHVDSVAEHSSPPLLRLYVRDNKTCSNGEKSALPKLTFTFS